MGFYKAVATSTGGSQVTWVTAFPQNPYTDYYAIGANPPRDELGTYEIYPLVEDAAAEIWRPSDISGSPAIYPTSGPETHEAFWERRVDSTSNVALKLSHTNMSTTWVRVNDTDIMPRSPR